MKPVKLETGQNAKYPRENCRPYPIESDISEFAWAAVSGIKVVPTMAQMAASGFTIRWRDVPKIAIH